MAAQVEIDESNGVSETVTHGIAHSRHGAIASANLDHTANPVEQGQNSFEKWKRWHVVLLGGAVRVQGLRYYLLAAPPGGLDHRYNGHTNQATYDGLKKTTYSQPATTALVATQATPATKPLSANIGIGGNLDGEITSDGGQSDYLVTQIRVSLTAPSGAAIAAVYSYDEVA